MSPERKDDLTPEGPEQGPGQGQDTDQDTGPDAGQSSDAGADLTSGDPAAMGSGAPEEDAPLENPPAQAEEPDAESLAVAGSGGSGGSDGSDDPGVPDDEEPESEVDEEDEEDEEEEDEEAGSMSLMDHLNELRRRIFRCIIAAAIGFIACYPFAKQLFGILMEPMVRVLETGKFIYTYPPEAFFTYLKVSLVAGVFLTSPYIFYQIWRFVAPGLYEHERKWIIPIALFSAVFFTAGALFGYFIVFPYGFEFFAGFGDEHIEFMPKVSEYLGFAMKLLFAFGLIFEMPLFVFFLARLGLVTAQRMRRYRKWAILLSFVVSAILTPPDPFTQVLMAGPLIILYEFSIWVARAFGKRKPAPEPDEDEDEDDEDEDYEGEEHVEESEEAAADSKADSEAPPEAKKD